MVKETAKKILLNVKRYRQRPAECALASTASLANFYDSTINYSMVRNLITANGRHLGIYSSHQARLFNQLGFSKVAIVSCDQDIVDFSWRKLNKTGLAIKIKQKRSYLNKKRNKDVENLKYIEHLIDFLEDEYCDNKLIIDSNYRKYIKRYLDHGRPVCASFNWTSMHKFSKGSIGDRGDITGDWEDHAVVIRGYDSKGIFVVDSHWQCYQGRWAKYKNGYYKIPWDDFLVNATGDLILIG